MVHDFDIIVIGAGIAGSSAAGLLSETRRVLLLEREEQPGYHSTGRSGAIFTEIYGSATVRALSRASRSFLFNPAPDFSTTALVQPRGAMFVARQDQMGDLEAFASHRDIEAATRWLNPDETCELSPLLRRDYVAAGVYEPAAMDVEVHSLQQSYLRLLTKGGGRLITGADVFGLARINGRWTVDTPKGVFSAPILINAAGAWADQIARLANVAPIGLVPCRRTAILVDAPDNVAIGASPLTIDISQEFYFKPDAGHVLVSPVDQTPSEPCDAQPDELDVAIAVHNIEKATILNVRHIRHKWAGLRNFVSDHDPVVGYAPDADGFFWLAAQGGYGIQTAPAMARLTAALVEGETVPGDIEDFGVSSADLMPARPSLTGA